MCLGKEIEITWGCFGLVFFLPLGLPVFSSEMNNKHFSTHNT